MLEHYLDSLVQYGLDKGLIFPEDRYYVVNRLLELLKLDTYTPSSEAVETNLYAILKGLLDYACQAGLIEDDVTSRDLFDTKLMGVLTPAPHEVQRAFRQAYAQSPQAATDYYYRLSRDTNYIRWDRIMKNRQWQADTPYGKLDLTINLSKPELPPTSLAALRAAPKTGYPLCLLCRENEGYAGRMNHPARQNLRPIPLTLAGQSYCLQYSPYVYYNEHCIVFSTVHTPMAIHHAAFMALLDFVAQFPHYFLGSNADLPIVGGSILTHAHFQGGRYVFAMEKAPVETPLHFEDFDDIQAGIVRWPMSVIRLRGADPARLAALADRILTAWRGYTDESALVFASTEGIDHNTITPIARRRGADYELDLVLRNNITTEEYPLGVFHPHAELHHIKKENIGLIEVMGLAVLPPRLKDELHRLSQLLLTDGDLYADPLTAKHADWAYALKEKYTLRAENVDDILRQEVGTAFAQVLEQAGVFKRTPQGRAAFRRFLLTLHAR